MLLYMIAYAMVYHNDTVIALFRINCMQSYCFLSGKKNNWVEENTLLPKMKHIVNTH